MSAYIAFTLSPTPPKFRLADSTPTKVVTLMFRKDLPSTRSHRDSLRLLSKLSSNLPEFYPIAVTNAWMAPFHRHDLVFLDFLTKAWIRPRMLIIDPEEPAAERLAKIESDFRDYLRYSAGDFIVLLVPEDRTLLEKALLEAMPTGFGSR